MRRNHVVVSLMVFMLLGIYACNSVETTSAMLHNDTGRYDLAIEQATLGIEKNPLDAEAYFQLAIAYSLKEDPDMGLAYQYFRKSAELDPKNKEGVAEENIGSNWAKHFNLGIAEYQSQNLEGAALEFQETTAADPRKVKGWLNLAMAYNQLAREDSTYLEPLFSATDSLMVRIGAEDQDYGKSLALAGKVMILKGEEDQAIEIFERLLLDDPTNATVIEQVGNDFLRADKFQSAADMFRMAADGYRRTETDNPDLYYNMGVCYLRTEQYLSAADAYQEVINVQPDNATAHYSRLLAYYQGEFWDEAIMYGQEYTGTVAPDDPRGWQILGLTYSKKNMKELAEGAIQKYQELMGQ